MTRGPLYPMQIRLDDSDLDRIAYILEEGLAKSSSGAITVALMITTLWLKGRLSALLVPTESSPPLPTTEAPAD